MSVSRRSIRIARSAGILAATIGLVIGSAGCQASPDPVPSPLAERVMAARERMHARLASARATELAVATGDLERAHAEARQIAARDEPDFLPVWRPYLDDIRRAAEQIAAAPDTVTAAKTMAQLGRVCGRCHEATNANIVFPREPAPVDTPKLGSQMVSHQWAAARMWEGVIGPSDERWLVGARTLASARLTITAETGELGAADDAARTKLLAQRAVNVGDHTDRAVLFGDLLAICAHCHATIRDQVLHPKSAALGPMP